MSGLDRVVKRLEQEVGLPRSTSVRIARKLNKLAESVSWATAIPDEPRKQKDRPLVTLKAPQKAARRR